MTYRYLLETLVRLCTDPRIHPNMPVVVALETNGCPDCQTDPEHCTATLQEIGLNGGELVLSATPLAAPLAR